METKKGVGIFALVASLALPACNDESQAIRAAQLAQEYEAAKVSTYLSVEEKEKCLVDALKLNKSMTKTYGNLKVTIDYKDNSETIRILVRAQPQPTEGWWITNFCPTNEIKDGFRVQSYTWQFFEPTAELAFSSISRDPELLSTADAMYREIMNDFVSNTCKPLYLVRPNAYVLEEAVMGFNDAAEKKHMHRKQ